MKSIGNLPGSDIELAYWKNLVQTDRFIDGWCAPWKNPELSEVVADFITKNLSTDEMVLDCGSGPVSILNGLVSHFQLSAIDPLANDYLTIFEYEAYEIKPPFAICVEDMEYLEKFFIVHMRNALDHTQDPVKGFEKMYRAVKPGGYLIIHGFENEGDHVSYQGFPQWNISVNVSNQMIITDKLQKVRMVREGAEYYQMVTLESGRKWFTWIEQKPLAKIS